ncbi:mechanosensitive ion channel [Mycobacterium frederiksbergense]|uniref:mechanosensitive ion channel domain-containing protein n=1 Tax=Mycolicibacterium frederiksbergense TaxID=117567 RepID=UPI0021F3C045|nr:mechanosensitive ion channel family protein [Mycolicibacterium frederiksbergense]MCV7048896.1 mechanosensitive ion channel [Mycolicibacterium frederiksbergense]
MTDLFGDPWFLWAVGVSIGLPVTLVLLTELRNALSRRGSALTPAVGLIRNYVAPLGALLLLLTEANEVSAETTPVRVIATVFGFVVLVLLLSGFNATLFQGAPEGTWRKRIPSIFLDVARFAVIAVGLAVILSFVWGADVGGLFTALGVTSIVLGLALQNSVGQIVSGLLLLFEQPFQLDDWLDTPSARGRVVEVNWRATHVDTGGGGLQIMPNSVLAAASFTNLSRPPADHSISVTSVFALEDPPDEVCAMLSRVASTLPQRRLNAAPKAVAMGGLEYRTSIPVRSPADDFAAKTTFLRWIWYASRRAELHLDEAEDDFSTPERVTDALHVTASALRLHPTDLDEVAAHVRLTRFGADESVQRPGEVPTQMMFIVKGRIRLSAPHDDGATVTVATLESGDFLGQTTLTREPVQAAAHALEEVTVLQIGRRHLEDLVMRNPLLLQEIGRAIEERRAMMHGALAAAAD